MTALLSSESAQLLALLGACALIVAISALSLAFFVVKIGTQLVEETREANDALRGIQAKLSEIARSTAGREIDSDSEIKPRRRSKERGRTL
jgi:hypothetical protein